jgi:hypothetical protein
MRVTSLTEQERAATGFSHAIRIGYSANPADNDFNVAAGSSAINAIALAAGDVVNYPLAQVYCKQAPTGVTAPTISVGVTGSAAQFIASGTPATGRSRMAIDVAATAGGPFESDGASKFVLVTIGGSNNLTNATAGEIWVYVNIVRAADLARLTG